LQKKFKGETFPFKTENPNFHNNFVIGNSFSVKEAGAGKSWKYRFIELNYSIKNPTFFSASMHCTANLLITNMELSV
jgi:hypothetical protein